MVSVEDRTEFPDTLVAEWILHEIFNDPTSLDTISRVSNGDWYSDKVVGLLITLVVTYYKRHHESPTKDAIVGNLKYLHENERLEADLGSYVRKFEEIISTPVDIDKDTLQSSIELFVKKSGMYHSFTDYMSAKSGVQSNSKKKVTFDTTFTEICKFSEFKLDNDIGFDYFGDFGKQLEYLMNPMARLPLGIEAIDAWTNGGIPKDGNFLGAFQAGTNVGKSLFLGYLAANSLKNDKTVVIITLELSQLAYGRRMAALLSGCNIDCLAAYKDEMLARINEFRQEHSASKLIIKEYPMNGTTTGEIDSYIERLKHEGIKPDLVIVDYLNLLSPSFCSKNEQQFIKVAIVAEQLRTISKKYSVPIFTATQSSRGSLMDAETKLSDMAQSLGLAVAADLILGLYCFMEEEGVVHMNCIKNRLGSKNYKSRVYHIDENTLEPLDMGDSADDSSEVDDVAASLKSTPQKPFSQKPQTASPQQQQPNEVKEAAEKSVQLMNGIDGEDDIF